MTLPNQLASLFPLNLLLQVQWSGPRSAESVSSAPNSVVVRMIQTTTLNWVFLLGFCLQGRGLLNAPSCCHGK